VTGLPEAIAVESPAEPPARSTLVLASHVERERNPALARELVARGSTSPYGTASSAHNSAADVDRVLQSLHELV
jgi:hypothetical protein